jgi:hypothetical protein
VTAHDHLRGRDVMEGHLSDSQLLLFIDGELDIDPNKGANHLEGCLSCQSRMLELKRSLAGFSKAHVKAWDGKLPSPNDARAGLIARISKIDAAGERNQQARSFPLRSITPRAMQWAAVAIACLSLAVLLRYNKPQSPSTLAGLWEKPNLRLTPGAIVPVTASQICGGLITSNDPAIPVLLEKKVLELYGVSRQPGQYEIDYLITPKLGGATDVRNLWPEPYRGEVWNSHVKDQLEDRLHQMVCQGDVDLTTAQHDISTDWIAAYRKYFHVDVPLPGDSSDDSESQSSLPRT